MMSSTQYPHQDPRSIDTLSYIYLWRQLGEIKKEEKEREEERKKQLAYWLI